MYALWTDRQNSVDQSCLASRRGQEGVCGSQVGLGQGPIPALSRDVCVGVLCGRSVAQYGYILCHMIQYSLLYLDITQYNSIT